MGHYMHVSGMNRVIVSLNTGTTPIASTYLRGDGFWGCFGIHVS